MWNFLEEKSSKLEIKINQTQKKTKKNPQNE